MEQILNGKEKFPPQSDLWKHILHHKEKTELIILFSINTKIDFT